MSEYRFEKQTPPNGSAAARKTPKSAVVCLVCGILSFLGFGLIGLFIIGIVAGLMALSKIKKSGGTLDGQGLAITGSILNGFAAVLVIVFYLFFLSGVLFYMGSSHQHKTENVNNTIPAR